MIGNAGSGKSFGGLIRYLMTGKDGQQPGRVDWHEVRNLHTDDPALCARIMRITSNAQREANSRLENDVYHLSISFDQDDQTDRQLERKVADTVLKDLGLHEHQAVLVRHNDTDYAHFHVAINRVHPETGKVWDDSHDWRRIEKSLRRQERELGLRIVPGHLHREKGLEAPDRSQSLTNGQHWKAKRDGQQPFQYRIQQQAKEALLKARSWQDLHRQLEERGLHLQKKGRGLVITDGHEHAKASSIDRHASLKAIEARLGPFKERDRELCRQGDKTRLRASQKLKKLEARQAARQRERTEQADLAREKFAMALHRMETPANDNRARWHREQMRHAAGLSPERLTEWKAALRATQHSRQLEEGQDMKARHERAMRRKQDQLEAYHQTQAHRKTLDEIKARQQCRGLERVLYRVSGQAKEDREKQQASARSLENANWRIAEERGRLQLAQQHEARLTQARHRGEARELERMFKDVDEVRKRGPEALKEREPEQEQAKAREKSLWDEIQERRAQLARERSLDRGFDFER